MKAALKSLKALFARKPKSPPTPRYCVDCAHFRSYGYNFPRDGQGSCAHPLNFKRNPVSGRSEHRMMHASDCRSAIGRCGLSGARWAPKVAK